VAALVEVEESVNAVEDDIKRLECELEKLNWSKREDLAELEDLRGKQEKLAEEKDKLMIGINE